MDNYCLKCMHLLNSDGICTHCHSTEADIRRAPHALTAGSLLRERYLIGSILGQGGFGITYIGRDLTLDMRVAIKEYYPSGFANRNTGVSDSITITDEQQMEFIEDGKKRFLKEAQVLAKFHGYPGVVDVRDFFEANNTAYIIMEYLEGQDLRQCIKEKLYPADTIFSLMAPIMDTLEKIHDAGIVHRDISPDNIMLLRNGTLKLMDFGAARGVNYADQKSLSVVLKAGYAPEEQYRPKGEQGPWTDIYALCATIYKCITGITPDDSLERMFDDTTQWPSQLGKEITVVQERVLQKGMATKQKDRFQNLGDMKKALLATEESFSAESQIPEANDPVTVYQPVGFAPSNSAADDGVTICHPSVPAPGQPSLAKYTEPAQATKAQKESKARPTKPKKNAKKELLAENAKDTSTKGKDNSSASAEKKGRKFVAIAAVIVAVIVLIAIVASIGTGKPSGSSSPGSSSSTAITDDSEFAPVATLAPDEIRAIPSILWGNHMISDSTSLEYMDLELTAFIDSFTNYQTIQYHSEPYEMSLLPYRIAVDPLVDESIIILTFADRFGETYDLYGSFTINESNILHVVPCETGPEQDLEAVPLQDTLVYQLKVYSYGDVRISSLGDSYDYGYLINETYHTGENTILRGAYSGTGAPDLQEISVVYRSEEDYDCSIMFSDGGITTDAEFTLSSTSSSRIEWSHVERKYNGRLEIFEESGNHYQKFINTYPYGFILIEDSQLIPYQNESTLDFSEE